MRLTPSESRYLTALAREQAQAGCRGPAHDLLRRHAYPDAPHSGKGSLAFSYEMVPLIEVLLRNQTDLQQLDDYLRKGELDPKSLWPWDSVEQFRSRLAEARTETGGGRDALPSVVRASA
jgi:hypothetical protein